MNKGIQELRNEVDKIYIEYNKREIKMRADMEDLSHRRAKYTAELDIELDLIKSKWWYKLFNYGK